MPGLQLTVSQAARLWHFDSALCTAVLSRLVEQRFLVETQESLLRQSAGLAGRAFVLELDVLCWIYAAFDLPAHIERRPLRARVSKPAASNF